MADKLTMTVKMKVTVPQALALQAMFNHWNRMSSAGASASVSFYVDGNGNFHPRAEVSFDCPVPALTPEIEKAAVCSRGDDYGACFDFDDIAWKLHTHQPTE